MLEPERETLEKCVYCPKLCRASCPVSEQEGSETVTPWGKMSMAYFVGRGDVPQDAEHTESAWACTGCQACRERCNHDNDVAYTLGQARASHFAAGSAPRAAVRVAESFDDHLAKTKRAVDAFDPEARASARVAVLVGCSYARNLAPEASRIFRLAQTMVGAEVRAIRACCGGPLLQAGDQVQLHSAVQRLREEVGDADTLLVADPGCAHSLQEVFPHIAPDPPPVQLLLDYVYARLDRVPAAGLRKLAVRYHDPCKLGRGLGRYEEPRAILARLLGAPPREMPRDRAQAECSGGGGLLPLTRPRTSAAIADARIAEHRAAGGGLLVSACAESIRRFRSRGEVAVDLLGLVAEAMGIEDDEGTP